MQKHPSQFHIHLDSRQLDLVETFGVMHNSVSVPAAITKIIDNYFRGSELKVIESVLPPPHCEPVSPPKHHDHHTAN